VSDSDPIASTWISHNARYAAIWPTITVAKNSPSDAAGFDGLGPVPLNDCGYPPLERGDGQEILGEQVAVHPTDAVGDAAERVDMVEDGAEVPSVQPAGEPFEEASGPTC
jgi:Domain of unknown function (DUF3470)